MSAPAHLRPETRRWFEDVAGEYVLASHHIHLLTLAAEALDRCAQARETIDREGLTVEGREGGVKTHPAVAVEKNSRAQFAALVKQLGLDDVSDISPRRVGRPGSGGIGVTWATFNGLPDPAKPGRRQRRTRIRSM
jgi:P27 family predicted phage terminase small subunit